MAVQWLRLCASIAGAMGSIPGGGTNNPHAKQLKKKKKKKKFSQLFSSTVEANPVPGQMRVRATFVGAF